ncbi:MAG: GHKL domain-containing protein [Thaumarchaeota archaeon]|nr:GHKL domain-containing protein [Nitrososphaerota archaeon]
MTLDDKKLSTSLDSMRQLEQELKGNYHALNELRQLQMLFESYSEKLSEKTNQLEKSNEELQKQTQRAENLAKIGELASSLTHNLRNPLGVITSTVKIIEVTSKDSLDEKTLSRLSRITNSANNMFQQIEDVLNFVRKKPLDIEKVSLLTLLQSAVNNIETPERVTINLPDNEILLECDFSKLVIVFMNLITNSIQAIENTGFIHIRINEDSGTVTIEIEDSGSGIPSELLPKIFDSLFTTKAAGTGLGLVYCKSIVEQHNGTITVKNNPTTFTIKLPGN